MAQHDSPEQSSQGANHAQTSPTSAHSHPPLRAFIGPAFVAAVAYVDPGNVAANISAGARYGHLLLWVLILANAISVLVQYQSAKLGIVTHQSLPYILGRRLPRKQRLLFWFQAELVAAATDLAEIIGGAIALNLLFDLPLIWGGIVIGLFSLLLLALQGNKKQRTFETIVMVLLGVITIGFIAGLFFDPPSPADIVSGVIPRFDGAGSVLVAASMLGATVMPHAIYLHSSLVNDHLADASSSHRPIKRLLQQSKIEVIWALFIAGGVNVCLLLVAATSLYGDSGTDTIDGAYRAIVNALGPAVATLFAVGLLASSLAATSVGAYAGSEIMRGLLHRDFSLIVRRSITLLPALIILAIGIEPSWALVISQVVLSFGIPFAIIPLMRCTKDASLMGKFKDTQAIQIVSTIATVLIIALNALLIVLTITG